MWTFHPTNKELFAHIKYNGTIMFTLHCEVTYDQGIAVANALNKVGMP